MTATGGFSRISPGQRPKPVCGMCAHIEAKRAKRNLMCGRSFRRSRNGRGAGYLPRLADTAEHIDDHVAANRQRAHAHGAVALELGMTGLSCSAYGAAEEAVINMALERSIPGTDAEDSFSAHICTDIARRVRSRSLLTSSGVSIEVTAKFTGCADDATRPEASVRLAVESCAFGGAT